MTIKLVRGAGDPTTGACWMSALSYYAGYAWSDHPECVDPVIRSLCIKLNDALPDQDRERVIGPHLMAPLGTNRGVELTRRRAFRCTDMAVRVWAPMALESAGLVQQAEVLRALPAIVDEASAYAAAYAANNEANATANAAAWAAANAANAAYAAYAAANAAYAEDQIIPLILELCAMGERAEIPQVRDLCDLPSVTP